MNLLSEIINSKNLRTLSFVFFNLSDENDEGFDIKITYRNSKFSSEEINEQIVRTNNELLCEYTNLFFEISGKSTHKISINNDLNLTRVDILKIVNSKIQQLRFQYTDVDFRSILINSFFTPRGSIDLNHSYYAVDILKQNISESYIDNLLSMLMSLEDIDQLNINFRELQPEFIEGHKKRNTQLRINLKWFYKNYYTDVNKLNVYKANILLNNSRIIMAGSYSKKISSGFIERALFYKEKILKNEKTFNLLSKKALNKKVNQLRVQLDFNNLDQNNESETKQHRDKTIIKLATISQPDVCFSCKNQYDIKDRTFKLRGTDRYYLEMHHVISFGADRSGDVLENLVKLCPSCHRALTPNRAETHYQKEIISNILLNSSASDDYVANFVESPSNHEQKIEFVYSNLK